MRNTGLENKLTDLKKRVEPFRSDVPLTGSLFSHLAGSIVSQQLSLKAAATIFGRFKALFPEQLPTAQRTLKLSTEELRGVGLSEAKTKAMFDLAQKTIDRLVPTDEEARRMSDQELIERLTQVRGVGKWTVEMVLMFRYRRPDVWPVDDLGVRHGFKVLFPKLKFNNAKELEPLGDRWKGKRSEIAWYCWRAIEEQQKQTYQGVPLQWEGLKLMLWLKGGVPARLDLDRTTKKPTPEWPGQLSLTQHRKAHWQKLLQEAIKNGSEASLSLSGSELQQRIWNEIRKIPFGETRTPKQIAEALQIPRQVKAVREACEINPLRLLVPCHRVVEDAKLPSSGKLARLKRQLRELEA